MHMYLRLHLAAVGVIVALVTLAGVAAGLRSLSVQRERFIGNSTTVIFEAVRGNTTCEVTLSGETTTTAIAKGSTAQIGQITEGRMTNCRGLAERGIVLAEARNSMRIRYNRTFTGTLPRISGVKTISANTRVQFTLVGGLIRCLYIDENFGMTLFERFNGQEMNLAEIIRAPMRLLAREFGCPPEVTVNGLFLLSPNLRVGLI